MSEYRVRHIGGDNYQAEMRAVIGPKSETAWVPLGTDGYWTDPECYSTGEVSLHPLTKNQADRAVWLARKINAGRQS